MSGQPGSQPNPPPPQGIWDWFKKHKDIITLPAAVAKLLAIPAIVTGAFNYVFHTLLGTLPLWTIYSSLGGIVLISLPLAWLCYRRWPGKKWPWLSVVLSPVGIAAVAFHLMPGPVAWTRIDAIRTSFEPPLDVLQAEIQGIGKYPGGNPFRKKVESWRKDRGVVQWAGYKSSVFPLNRAPHRIALKNPKLSATLGAYIFVKGPDGWKRHKMVGFSSSQKLNSISLDYPKEGGHDFCIVLFIFPFTEGAASELQKTVEHVVEAQVD